MEKIGVRAVFETSEFQRGMAIYNSGVLQINNVTQQAANQSKKSSADMEMGFRQSFGKIAASIAALVAAFKALQASTKFLQESAMLAARVETLGVALDSVGSLAGYTTKEIDAYTKAVEEKGITTQAARQSLLQMAQAEISFSHSADLARIAQDAAVIANINSSEAFEQLVYGIQTGQVRVLRTMGIMVNFEAAYKKYADTLGVTTEELNEADKAEARLQAVMEKGALIAGTYESAMGTVGKQVTSLPRYFEQLQLAIGNVLLQGFSAGIQELTGILKDLQKWVDENQDSLAALSDSFGALVEALIRLAGIEIDTEGMDNFIAQLTALIDTLTIAIDGLAKFKETVQGFREAGALGKRGTVMGGALEDEEKAAKAMEALHDKAIATREKKEDKSREREKFLEEQRQRGEAMRAEQALEEQQQKEKEVQEKAAEDLTKNLDKLQGLQKDYYRNLAKMEADQNRERAKAERDYLKSVEKERAAGAKRLADTTEKYEKQQAKTIADYQKSMAKAEKEIADQRVQAERQYALQEKQAKERYNLDRIQSERRFQYEKAKAIAEGDTLAIEELNAQYAMEQQEAQENEELRRRQAGESQEEQIRQAGEEAQKQLDELRMQLEETLTEQDQAYQEQIADQQQANAERMADMALNYEEQAAMREEQNALARQQAEENHLRQLEDLGQNLADQEELQEIGADKVSQILAQYYGEDGLADQIMQGWHDRENERIMVTAEMLAGMAAVPEIAPPIGGYATGYGIGMDVGGIVQGPATVRVGAGIVEAFTPLNRGGGGNLSVSWAGGPIPITGLESASPSNVNDVARALAESLTAKVRVHRRN